MSTESEIHANRADEARNEWSRTGDFRAIQVAQIHAQLSTAAAIREQNAVLERLIQVLI